MPRIACSKVKHSDHSRPQTCLQRFTILSHCPQKTVMRSKVWSSVDLATRSLRCYYRLLSSIGISPALPADAYWATSLGLVPKTQDSEDLGQSAVAVKLKQQGLDHG